MKKLLIALLAACMVLTCCPVSAFALDGGRDGEIYPLYDRINMEADELVGIDSLLLIGNGVSRDQIKASGYDGGVLLYDNKKLYAYEEGTTDITFRYGDSAVSLPVHVYSELAEPTGLSLDKSSLTVNVGSAYKLVPSFAPVNARAATVSWQTSDPGVCTVDGGLVEARAGGTCVITATAGGLSASCEVTVTNNMEKITVSDLTLLKGETQALTVSVYPSGSDDGGAAAFESSDPAVASVDASGNVTGVSGGVATITVNKSGFTATCKVRVEVPLEGISFEGTQGMLMKNASVTLKVNYAPEDTTADKTVTWTSDKPEVAKVSSAGKVTALKQGIATITAAVGDKTADYTVIVKEIPITGISLNYTTRNVLFDDTFTLKATVAPSDTTDTVLFNWSSEDTDVASVDTKGNVTAKGVGTTYITAKCGDFSAKCKVTVNPVKLRDCTYKGIKDIYYTGQTPDLEDIEVSYHKIGLLFKYASYTMDDPVSVGTCTITFRSKSPNFDDEGGYVKTFEIKPADINWVNFKYNKGVIDKAYTGSPVRQDPVLRYYYKDLVKDKDYKLLYSNYVKPGTATVKIVGMGNFTGVMRKEYQIYVNLSTEEAKVTSQKIARKTYSGKAQKPKPWVKAVGEDGNVRLLKEGIDFKYLWYNNVKVGQAYLLIEGLDGSIYRGSKRVNFNIYPKTTSVTKVTPLSKGFKVTWAKQAVQTDGYQIEYSSRSDFKTYALIKVDSTGTIAKSIYHLKGLKTYYVRIRTYKVVDGKTYYSNWSAAKTVKTKN